MKKTILSIAVGLISLTTYGQTNLFGSYDVQNNYQTPTESVLKLTPPNLNFKASDYILEASKKQRQVLNISLSYAFGSLLVLAIDNIMLQPTTSTHTTYQNVYNPNTGQYAQQPVTTSTIETHENAIKAVNITWGIASLVSTIAVIKLEYDISDLFGKSARKLKENNL